MWQHKNLWDNCIGVADFPLIAIAAPDATLSLAMDSFRHGSIAKRAGLGAIVFFALLLQTFVAAAVPIAAFDPRPASPVRTMACSLICRVENIGIVTDFAAFWVVPLATTPLSRQRPELRLYAPPSLQLSYGP